MDTSGCRGVGMTVMRLSNAKFGLDKGLVQAIIVPSMKVLDIAVENGIKPSQILLSSEIKFSQKDNISEAEWIIDEAQEIPESVYRTLSRSKASL